MQVWNYCKCYIKTMDLLVRHLFFVWTNLKRFKTLRVGKLIGVEASYLIHKQN